MEDRLELLKLSGTDEDTLAASRINDWPSPAFRERVLVCDSLFNPGPALHA
jgi:hypothetical protein